MNTLFLFFRSTLFLVGQVISAVIFSMVAPFLILIPFTWRYWFITRWSVFVIWWAKTTCGLQYKIIGKENLPTTPSIVLCKHQSTWETLFLQTLLPPQTWVLKRELLWIPFFGWGLALLNPIAVDRKKKNKVKQMIEQATRQLQAGRWVIIFPEGTRVAPNEKRRYTKSGAALSISSGFAIVPIAHNAGCYWPKNAFIKKPGTITVVIGKAIEPSQMSAEALTATVEAWIEETVNQLYC